MTTLFLIREECAFEGTACLSGDLQLVVSEEPVSYVFLEASLLSTQSFPVQNDKDW